MSGAESWSGPASPDDQERVRAAGLRRVALASVAALAIVLPLAAVTGGAGHVGPERTSVGHSATSSHDD